MILTLVVVAAILAIQLFRLYTTAHDFESEVGFVAVYARQSTDQSVREALLTRAGRLGVKLDPADIQITRGPDKTYAIIEVRYTIPLGLLVTSWDVSFQAREERHRPRIVEDLKRQLEERYRKRAEMEMELIEGTPQ